MTCKALLVGINEYPGCLLRGCIHDVEAVAALLVEKCGWQRAEIRLLTDARATTDAILERLRWLVDGATAGDRLVFQYSGHGAQFAGRDSNGRIQALQDCICPADFDWSPGRMILTDDFWRIFGIVPEGCELTWVSDSCHSGDLSREAPSAMSRPRAFPVPADMAWRIATAGGAEPEARRFSRAVEHLRGALLAGCRSDQTSADAFIDGEYRGAFTAALLASLSLADGLATPIADVMARAHNWLDRRQFSQEPQLRGEPRYAQLPWLGGTA